MIESGDERGDAPAAKRLEALVRAHRAAVVTYVRRRAPPEAVDDLVAETFLVAWRRLDRVPAGQPLPWLLAVARNLIATQRRSAARRDALHLRLQAHTPAQATDSPSLDEPTGPVVQAMAQLSEKDREALLLVACDGLRPREAAKVMGDLPGTFRVRLHRAKRRLRRLLENQRPLPAHLSSPVEVEETAP